MMKGYLTVFLSLTLSILTGFVLLLTGYAIQNGWKVRTEMAADLGMNSVLGEYHTMLYDRYGLLYVDASYEGKEPSLSHVESRLAFYISQNLKKEENAPFGEMNFEAVDICKAVSAAAGKGRSMKRQAVMYYKDGGYSGEEEILAGLKEMHIPEGMEVMSKWQSLMESIGEMELPMTQNEEGLWEEVPLNNPADGAYGLLGSDILYLAGMENAQPGDWKIKKEDYFSEQSTDATGLGDGAEIPDTDTETFLLYLYDKLGYYGNAREGSMLQYQLEYVAKGKSSDYENCKAVAEELLLWRFAVNADFVMGNSSMQEEAMEVASLLYAVRLNAAFREPVARSILYAWAFLEAVGEVKCLLEGGRVPLLKSSIQIRLEQVLAAEVPDIKGGEGYNYAQYLAFMLYRLPEDIRNLRCMDIMEMDIRKLTGNPYFSMNYCIERFTAQMTVKDRLGKNYDLVRTYGYY